MKVSSGGQDSYNLGGSEDDEDHDDQHDHADDDHHLYVLPPVFAGDARRRSLEGVGLKEKDQKQFVKK